MGRNVEIKARIRSVDDIVAALEALGAEPAGEWRMEDTFFDAPEARLKLRVIEGAAAHLIAYRRPDLAGPSPSEYEIAEVSDPGSMWQVLAMALGECGCVRKTRRLYMVGRTRVHVDDVETLGHFVELEVVLAEGEPDAAGAREARRLMQFLGIGGEDLLTCAYVDLLPDERAARG